MQITENFRIVLVPQKIWKNLSDRQYILLKYVAEWDFKNSKCITILENLTQKVLFSHAQIWYENIAKSSEVVENSMKWMKIKQQTFIWWFCMQRHSKWKLQQETDGWILEENWELKPLWEYMFSTFKIQVSTSKYMLKLTQWQFLCILAFNLIINKI